MSLICHTVVRKTALRELPDAAFVKSSCLTQKPSILWINIRKIYHYNKDTSACHTQIWYCFTLWVSGLHKDICIKVLPRFEVTINTMIKGFKAKSLDVVGQSIVTFEFNILLPRELTWIQQSNSVSQPVLNKSNYEPKQTLFVYGVLVSRFWFSLWIHNLVY